MEKRSVTIVLAFLCLAVASLIAHDQLGTTPSGDAERAQPAASRANAQPHHPDKPQPGAALRGSDRATPATPRTSGLTGRVLDDVSGAPIPNARVMVVTDETRDTLTDADGRFQLGGLSPGPHWIVVRHALFIPAGIQQTTDKAGRRQESARINVPAAPEQVGDVIVRLRAGRRIEGQVVDASGRPVAGAKLLGGERVLSRYLHETLGLHGATRSQIQRVAPLRIKSDEQGRFVLACVPESRREFRLGAHTPKQISRWSEPIALGADESPERVRLDLIASASVAGRVLAHDQVPASDVTVFVDSDAELMRDWALGRDWIRQIEVDAEGRFEFPVVPPDALTLQPVWNEPWLRGNEAPQDPLRPGEARTDVVLTLPPRLVLTGTLRSTDGVPLRGEELVLVVSEGQDGESLAQSEVASSAVRTDADGAFAMATTAKGRFDLVHLKPNRQSRVVATQLTLPLTGLDARSSPTPTTRLELRVLTREGEPVPRFRSTIMPSADAWAATTSSLRWTSDVDGEQGVAVHFLRGAPLFQVHIGQATTWERAPLPYAHESRWMREIPEDGVLEVRLPRTDEIVGMVVGPNGEPVPGVRLYRAAGEGFLVPELDEDSREDVALDGTGNFRIRLPADTDASWWLITEVPDGWVKPDPTALDPQEGDLILQVNRGGTITGKLLVDAPFPSDSEIQPSVSIWWSGNPLGRPVPVAPDGTWEAPGVPLDTDLKVGLSPQIARHFGYIAPPPVEGARVGNGHVEIPLKRGLAIRGEVVWPDSQRVARPLTVICFGTGPHTDVISVANVSISEPEFSFGGLPKGQYRIEVYDHAASVHLLKHLANTGVQDLKLPVPPVGTLTLKVPPSARTLQFAEITIRRLDTTELVATTYGSEGTEFEFEGLPIDVDYTITLSDETGVAAGRGRAGGPAVQLTRQASEELSGRIHGATADELENSEWVAFRAGACFALSVDADGSFSAEWGVLPGIYEIRQITDAGKETIHARGVAAGNTDVKVNVR